MRTYVHAMPIFKSAHILSCNVNKQICLPPSVRYYRNSAQTEKKLRSEAFIARAVPKFCPSTRTESIPSISHCLLK